MEIKTAEEILNECLGEEVEYTEDIIKMAINKARKEILDYASENVEVDYEVLQEVPYNEEVKLQNIEVFITKGEFDKIKELIK